jgi:hypothetical protein
MFIYYVPGQRVGRYITQKQFHDAGFDPETITKFKELFSSGQVTKEKLHDARFDSETIQKFEELSKNGMEVIRAPGRVTPHLTKEQLRDAGIDHEKIQKYAELFPDGTEVTCELCVKYPDVFSFGKQGCKLLSAMNAINDMPDVHLHSEYNAEIEKADKTRLIFGRPCPCQTYIYILSIMLR